jgi:hypothetical protein
MTTLVEGINMCKTLNLHSIEFEGVSKLKVDIMNERMSSSIWSMRNKEKWEMNFAKDIDIVFTHII